ncbi:helix-turn-helix domain-containing protein [Vibrio sp. nBUS_14]
MSIHETAKFVGVSPRTVVRVVKRMRAERSES